MITAKMIYLSVF